MANYGQAISNAGSGAATGAAVGGPWGALVGGAVGGLTGLFSDDPEEQRRKAQAEYDAKVRQATGEYTTSQGQILDEYGNLYTPSGVKTAKEGYTSALTSADPTQYAINAGDYQSTYSDPLTSWQKFLDPSIKFQQESARKNVEESAAGQGGLYSGAAAGEISRDVADIASTGYNEAFRKAREAGMDINDITGENFDRGVTAGRYNVDLGQTGISNMGTAYGVERDLMDTEMGGRSDINKTIFDTKTGMASTNLSGDLGNIGGPSTWDQIIGGVGAANDAGVFNKSFWNFGSK